MEFESGKGSHPIAFRLDKINGRWTQSPLFPGDKIEGVWFKPKKGSWLVVGTVSITEMAVRATIHEEYSETDFETELRAEEHELIPGQSIRIIENESKPSITIVKIPRTRQM